MAEGSPLYDRDFYAWAVASADLIRAGRLSEVDLVHVAEELEGMGKSERRALTSRLEVLAAHLLKWKLQPGLRSNSWRYTVKEQRRKVERLLEESPSLGPEIEALLTDAYPDAVLLAARETGLDEDAFPATCPFSAADALAADFWPD
jgi:hypothetical protein